MNYKRTKFSACLSLPAYLLAMAALALALAGGCATTKQTEHMLTEAGFKAQPANTEQQQAHLRALPHHKISTVHRNGTTYFVYPDVTHNLLYIGQSADYQRYQKLQQEALEQTPPAEQMQENFTVWGDW